MKEHVLESTNEKIATQSDILGESGVKKSLESSQLTYIGTSIGVKLTRKTPVLSDERMLEEMRTFKTRPQTTKNRDLPFSKPKEHTSNDYFAKKSRQGFSAHK